MNHILLVDDDARFRKIIAKTLSTAGYDVVEARNGSDGIAAARHSRPALVITDLVMPEKEGIETIRELRREHPGLPIIAMSGYTVSSNFYLQAATKLGADTSLAKPFGSDELLTAVRGCLGEARPGL